MTTSHLIVVMALCWFTCRDRILGRNWDKTFLPPRGPPYKSGLKLVCNVNIVN
jgi:hypothetical protein